MNTKYDLIIIGSGLVGAAFAAALKNTNLKIALIDQAPPFTPKPITKDGRKLVLSFGSSKILAEYGLWEPLANVTTPIEQLHVSQQGHFSNLKINAAEYDVPALGYVLPAELLIQQLQENLLQLPHLTLFQPAKLTQLTLGSEQSSVTIIHAEQTLQLTAKLIIACDGNHSTARTLAGIGIEEKQYQKTALITRVKLARTHHNTAYQRFTKQGILAMLPMENQTCGFIWSAPTDEMSDYLALDDAALLAEIQKYFGYRVGKLLNIEDRYSYPIQEIIAKEQTKPGLLLLGNAAHNLSPVAAQGFNLALQDIYVLANLCCAENLQAETVIGCYLAAREKSQKNVIRFTDSLMRWFNPDNPLNIFASFGLAICDGIPPLKRRVAELGMGLTAPVKELLKKNS